MKYLLTIILFCSLSFAETKKPNNVELAKTSYEFFTKLKTLDNVAVVLSYMFEQKEIDDFLQEIEKAKLSEKINFSSLKQKGNTLTFKGNKIEIIDPNQIRINGSNIKYDNKLSLTENYQSIKAKLNKKIKSVNLLNQFLIPQANASLEIEEVGKQFNLPAALTALTGFLMGPTALQNPELLKAIYLKYPTLILAFENLNNKKWKFVCKEGEPVFTNSNSESSESVADEIKLPDNIKKLLAEIDEYESSETNSTEDNIIQEERRKSIEELHELLRAIYVNDKSLKVPYRTESPKDKLKASSAQLEKCEKFVASMRNQVGEVVDKIKKFKRVPPNPTSQQAAEPTIPANR